MCSALCAENNLVFGNEERFCQFWNAMSRWICKRNIKQAALLLVAPLADRVGNVGVSAPTADRQTQAAPVLESGIAT